MYTLSITITVKLTTHCDLLEGELGVTSRAGETVDTPSLVKG